jgi:flagellar protein FliJ
MRKFHFKLQRLLDYRQTIEDKLLAELAAIQAEHAREADKLRELIYTRNQFRDKIRRGLCDSDDPDDIKRNYTYLHDLSRRVSAHEVSVARIWEKRNRKMAEVVEASKERKTLDRLREYEVAMHQAEGQRQEQKFLDDVAGVRHRREKQAVVAPSES